MAKVRMNSAARAGWWAAWLLLCLFVLPGTDAAAASFSVSLDRENISVGETATLTMKFEGGSIKGLPALPQIPGLRFSQALGHTSSISIINGVSSSAEVYSYEVTPTQTGKYTIPALTAEIVGQTCESQPLTLTASKAEAGGGSNAEEQMAFMRLAVKKENIHVGEMVEAEFQLFLHDGVLGVQNFQLDPIQAEGFTVGKSRESEHSQARIGNTSFTVIPYRMVFTAVKAGTLKLGPLACSMDLLFGPTDFFGRPSRSRHMPLTSEEVKIEVLPLPEEGKPSGFSGAVGDYKLNIAVSPTNVAVGDPLTVSIQITGRGALESITLPQQTGWDKFKLYPPTSDYAPSDDLGLSGTRTFKLTAVPESMEIQQLPEYVFSFYDPNANLYKTVKSPRIPLVVRPSAASLPPPGLAVNVNSSDNPQTNLDILHIKPFLGQMEIPQAPLIVRPWFLALQSIPALAWLALLVRRVRSEKLAANPRLKRQRQVEKTVRNGLKQLRESAAAGEQEVFFATMFRLLQERLGEKLDLPSSAITEAVLDERLRPQGVEEGVLAQARELFQACDQARYSRQSTNEELMSLVTKLETCLEELGRLKP